MARGRATWLLYAVFACMAFLLNGLGAVLGPLRTELHVTRGDVAVYPALFAIGLVVIGLVGGPLVDRVGRAAALRLSLGLLLAGGLLFAWPEHALTLFGDLLIGLGSALLIQLVPALLGALHRDTPAAAVGEANGLASATSVLAPLAVAAAISAGLGWRAGYLAAPLIVLVVVAAPLGRADLPPSPAAATAPRRSAASLLGRWLDLVIAVSVEFCMVFWAASAVAEWHGTSLAEAPAVASLFLVGMASCRILAAPITGRLGSAGPLMLVCVAVAGLGFALFWAAPNLKFAAAGLVVTGLGVGLLYPTTVSRVIAAWPDAPDRAAARAALGSGLAIGGAPFVLGRLSDAVGLRTAYLIVPCLLLLLAVRAAAPGGRLVTPGHGHLAPGRGRAAPDDVGSADEIRT